MGGGKSIAGFYAYYEAVKELHSQLKDIDAVFVACGTGTTLTGICAGMQCFYPKAKVHAISVARNHDAEMPVLIENMRQLNMHLKSDYDFSNLSFHDEFVSGGYGKASKEILGTIRECISHEGITVDPTYTGKAFHGMTSILSTGIYSGKNILFWNTGGAINLLSQKDLFCSDSL